MQFTRICPQAKFLSRTGGRFAILSTIMKMKLLAAILTSCALSAFAVAPSTTAWLDELNLAPMTSGWETPRAKLTIEGKPLVVKGVTFGRGVGTHAASDIIVMTRGAAARFHASVGVPDETKGKGTIIFEVLADGRTVATSGVMKGGEAAKPLDADLTGATNVILRVTDAEDGEEFDHAVWGDAVFTLVPGGDPRPDYHRGRLAQTNEPIFQTAAVPVLQTTQFGILTPPAGPAPRINGPRSFGVRPGHPILFSLPVAGERPMTFSAKGLPPGAVFDAKTGRLSGAVTKPGTYRIVFAATNAKGSATRDFDLVVGDKIALTPPMGWNSWNCFAYAVSAKDIKAAADAMVKAGLVDHGWSYINIDDFWQHKENIYGDKSLEDLLGPARDAQGQIVPNKRFPDMKGLADYVHGLGLKIGLYSSPGPLTCGGCYASWQHEEQDAKTYAAWGFDYLKYDWCSYSRVGTSGSLKGAMKPYLQMGAALKAQDRDIVFSLCQYGMQNVSTWGAAAGGQCWRTTGDITDTWASMIGIADQQDGLGLFTAPDAWNDPDMLVVGRLGWGRLRPTRLTPNEQYTHISLWSILAAPLLIGCDMTQLDAFTLNLLENDEVLDINQSPDARGATRIAHDRNGDVWVRPLADGDYAAVLVNRTLAEGEVVFKFADAGLQGTWAVRDLWRQQDLGQRSGELRATLPGHAPLFVRLHPVR